MLWYLLERYVHVLLGRTHLCLPKEEQSKYEKSAFYLNLENKVGKGCLSLGERGVKDASECTYSRR